MVRNMDDNMIVRLFFERSEQAIIEISKKYGSLCHAIAANILKNNSDAEECVNDAYLGVWNTIPPQNPTHLLTYTAKIVRNLAIKKYHSNRALKRNSYYDVAITELEECIPSNYSVEDEIDAKILTQHLNEFLETLDKTNRMIFVSRYWYAYSISEIARKFQMSNHTTTMRLARTREKLRDFLLKEGIEI